MGRRRRRRVTKAAGDEPEAMVKVGTIGAEPGATRVLPEGEQSRAFTTAGAIPPPYDPQTLARVFEHSHALRPNVEAYATNIEGFPWRLEQTIDLDAKDADEQIKSSLQIEKVFDRSQPSAELTDEEWARALVVTEEEVEARKTEIASAIVLEKLQAQMFFEGLSVGEISFTELRKRTRTDVEVTGNAYWEVVRDSYGRICQLNHAAAAYMRLMPTEQKFTAVWQEQKISPISYRRVKRWRRFRRFVQLRDGAELIYFKEFGDLRVLGARSGKFYDSEEQGKEREGSGWLAATEIIHHKIHSPLSAYGVPRWVGAWPAVMGGRAAEEVNESFFDNKAIPPMAITVSGGVMAKGAVKRIERYLRDNIKGRRNFWKVMVLEAEGKPMGAGQQPPRIAIDIKPLMKDVPQDALFLKYSGRSDELIGTQFRNPRLVRGEMGDFNRATADVAMRFVEQQVYAPLRMEGDHGINSKLLAELRIRFWKFASGSPIAKDPKEQAEMIKALSDFFIPGEARRLIGPLFGIELPEDDSDWTKQPLAVSLMRLQAGLPMLEEEESGTVPVDVEQTLRAFATADDNAPIMSALKQFAAAARKQAAEQATVEERRLLESEAGPAEPETVTLRIPVADFEDPDKLGAAVVGALEGADASPSP